MHPFPRTGGALRTSSANLIPANADVNTSPLPAPPNASPTARRRRDGVAVDGDMFIYYIGRDRHGKPALASIAPDVFVVFGVADRRDRNSYPLWREPDADLRFVLEIASPSTTRARGHGAKRSVYASLGVREYFLFDPPGRRRRARIMGLTLRSRGYSDMPTEVLPNGGRSVRSAVLGLVAYVNGEGELRSGCVRDKLRGSVCRRHPARRPVRDRRRRLGVGGARDLRGTA